MQQIPVDGETIRTPGAEYGYYETSDAVPSPGRYGEPLDLVLCDDSRKMFAISDIMPSETPLYALDGVRGDYGDQIPPPYGEIRDLHSFVGWQAFYFRRSNCTGHSSGKLLLIYFSQLIPLCI